MTDTRTAPAATTSLRLLQVFATLTVLNVLAQYVTAGTLFSRGEEGLEELHDAGALALHVTSFLALAAAGLHQRRTGGPLWPAILAGVLFVLSFLQPLTGERDMLALHIPGAMILSIGAVWVMAWAFTGAGRTGRIPAAR